MIAVDPDTGQSLGTARYVRSDDDPRTAEFAVGVGDRWMRIGLGTALLSALVLRAREAGITRFTGLIHADNTAIRRLVEKVAGPYETTSTGEGATEIVVDLGTGGHPPPHAGRERTATVIPLDELRKSETAALFEGGDLGVSIFVTRYERGQGPALHLHPYPEVFVVQEGTATFTVGDEELVVTEGHIVVVPEQTPHAFKCSGDDVLRVVSVHPSGRVEQTNL